jgi:hypothetical protein
MEDRTFEKTQRLWDGLGMQSVKQRFTNGTGYHTALLWELSCFVRSCGRPCRTCDLTEQLRTDYLWDNLRVPNTTWLGCVFIKGRLFVMERTHSRAVDDLLS